MLKITKTREEHIVRFNLSGAINVNSHDEFQRAIVNDRESARDNIIVNCEELSNVSCSGIGILVTACMQIQKQGRIIKFVHIDPEILEKTRSQ